MLAVVAVALALGGCGTTGQGIIGPQGLIGQQGIIGGREPTIVECDGKAQGNVGPYPLNMQCDKFKAKINVQ
jgi:hypothetical protein